MSRIQRFAILAAVATGSVLFLSSGDPGPQPPEYDLPSDIPEDVLATLSDARKAELTRRPRKPEGDREWYDRLLNRSAGADTQGNPHPVAEMPATNCRSVEPIPRIADKYSPPRGAHALTVHMFETQSGFGFWRMRIISNQRGVHVAAKEIDRVELVSLLTDIQPSVYVLDEMATPSLARHATRRPLDEFESRGLEAVRKGEDLVWTREAPKRMFGAIRAKADCLDCHSKAKEGDLLGAFTYYLDVPVDQIER